jgi:peptidoglycan-associated lipoprotein
LWFQYDRSIIERWNNATFILLKNIKPGENLMRFSYVICAFAGLTLAACESNPEVNSSTTSDGSSSGPSVIQEGTGGPVTTGVISQPVNTQSPGSAEDFVVNVGDRVLFGFDRFDLDPESRAVIENQITWLKRFPSITVSVEGHTDERGTREYNLALGERRANSVRDYMIALGVDPNRVKTISYGKERPVDPGSSVDAWSSNRRAVTVVESSAG